MDDIGSWLEQNGFGKYVDLFLENEIEVGDLAYLTDADLVTLGLPMGPRKRLMASIQNTRPESPAYLESNEVARTDPPFSSIGAGAEHRQLTVMFADLVGSVELGERMDLEDYRDLLSRFRSEVVAAVRRYEGFVARHQGDGILVYFGYPRAHENDAERSIRAGLAVLQAVGELQHPYSVVPAVRVGVATGDVIVGDLVEADGASEFGALGQTPNLAARLQSQAAAQELIVSEATHKLAGQSFTSESLGPLSLRGFQTPVRAFRITAESTSTDRGTGNARQRLSPLVGRSVEIALLQDRWTKTKEGAGQVVLIAAEPGVGKSRLLQEFRQHLHSEQHVSIPLYCSPYQTNSALYPVTDLLKRRFQLIDDTGDSVRLDALARWVCELALEPSEYVPLLASLLELSLGSPYEELTVTGEQLRKRTLEALVRLIETQSATKPTLLIAEDLHWVDPTTQEFIGQIVQIARHNPICMLLTHRPEYSSPWGGEPHLTEVRLNHLTRRECRSFIENIATSRGLSDALVESIVERTDGVPLFVEELAKAVLEAEDPEAIPASLRDALTARLDMLEGAKEVAQAASVLGREFRSELLPILLDVPATEIGEDLKALVGSGLVNQTRPAPTGDHQFKHALVRDAAYESLLRAPRQRLHRRAAQALSNVSPAANSAVIAHHLEQAGAIEEAAACWETAGQEARQRWAHAETAAHFRHALALAEQHGFGHEVRIRLVSGLAYSMHLNGERSQADRLMEQNSVLETNMVNRNLAGWFYCVWAEISSFLGKRHTARIHCEKALEAGRESGDGQLVATALVGLSTEDFFTERFRPIIERNEEALSLLAQEPSLVWQAAAALSRCLFGLGYAAVHLGDISRARTTLERFDEFDQKLRRTVSEHPTAAMRAVIGIAQGNWDEVVDAVNAEMNERPSPFADAVLHYFLTCAVLGQGDIERAVPMLEEGLRKAERYRSEQVQLWAAVALGNGYCDAGRLDDAATVASNCKERAALIQVPDTDAVLLEGRVALERAELDKAYRLISAAKADYVTREMGPKQAQSLCYLAIAAGRQGNRSEAFEHLQNAHRIYSEMDAKWHVEKTRSLAEQLGMSGGLATA